ncbi:MAG TPA: hypothetical protein VMF06_17525 [Candidatus Limnocylindria bacterium]|nr:hypothetical protein [Candidatus Limnocylindria bacterium]
MRSPLHGIGGHWDEWFRHEASVDELRQIQEAGHDPSSQRRFMAWLRRHWARETEWRSNVGAVRFALSQLAQVPPFHKWQAFDEFRTGYGVPGISAVVLIAESVGEADDVRKVEALVLPQSDGPCVVTEGFRADANDLITSRRAAENLTSGGGLLRFLALWVWRGERPHPRWLAALLAAAWGTLGAAFLYLWLGPDPGNYLYTFAATLLGAWLALLLAAGLTWGKFCLDARRAGRLWKALLQGSEIRLRMEGGLTVKGGSAGLPFSLNVLLSLFLANPLPARRSWIWRQLFANLREGAARSAATGVVTSSGSVLPVILEPKLRACLLHGQIKQVVTPRQRPAPHAFAPIQSARPEPARQTSLSTAPIGFAAEYGSLQSHRARHLADALMALGRLNNRWQPFLNSLALLVSVAMIVALADFKAILLPPPTPSVVAPISPSLTRLWVSLDTKRPEAFRVALDSRYWANRRVDVAEHKGANGSVRAEIYLDRIWDTPVRDPEDGTVWIERRHKFLNREFHPGERVGRYSLSYINKLGHD